MVSSGRDNAEEKIASDIAHVAGNENESRLSRGDHFQDDLVEYIGTILAPPMRVAAWDVLRALDNACNPSLACGNAWITSWRMSITNLTR